MNIELVAGDENSCQLIERAGGVAVTNTVAIPASKDAVVAVMKEMLLDANKDEAELGPITVARWRDMLRLTAGVLVLEIRWKDVFPLVLKA